MSCKDELNCIDVFCKHVLHIGYLHIHKDVHWFHHRWYMYEHIVFTAHIVFIHILSVVKPVYIFMTRNRVSKSCLMAEFCFHRFVYFNGVPICIFDFHHKQCASDSKDFISVKFTSQLFSDGDESLKDEKRLLLI